jgi:hypothetical protein
MTERIGNVWSLMKEKLSAEQEMANMLCIETEREGHLEQELAFYPNDAFLEPEEEYLTNVDLSKEGLTGGMVGNGRSYRRTDKPVGLPPAAFFSKSPSKKDVFVTKPSNSPQEMYEVKLPSVKSLMDQPEEWEYAPAMLNETTPIAPAAESMDKRDLTSSYFPPILPQTPGMDHFMSFQPYEYFSPPEMDPANDSMFGKHVLFNPVALSPPPMTPETTGHFVDEYHYPYKSPERKAAHRSDCKCFHCSFG